MGDAEYNFNDDITDWMIIYQDSPNDADSIDFYANMTGLNSKLQQIDEGIMVYGNMLLCRNETFCGDEDQIGPINNAFPSFGPFAINNDYKLNNTVVAGGDDEQDFIDINCLYRIIYSSTYDTISSVLGDAIFPNARFANPSSGSW